MKSQRSKFSELRGIKRVTPIKWFSTEVLTQFNGGNKNGTGIDW